MIPAKNSAARSQFRNAALQPPCTSLVQQATRPAPYCHQARTGSFRSLHRETVASGFSVAARYPLSCGKPGKSVMEPSVTAGVNTRFCTYAPEIIMVSLVKIRGRLSKGPAAYIRPFPASAILVIPV